MKGSVGTRTGTGRVGGEPDGCFSAHVDHDQVMHHTQEASTCFCDRREPAGNREIPKRPWSATPSPHSTYLLSRHAEGCGHAEASLIQSFQRTQGGCLHRLPNLLPQSTVISLPTGQGAAGEPLNPLQARRGVPCPAVRDGDNPLSVKSFLLVVLVVLLLSKQ